MGRLVDAQPELAFLTGGVGHHVEALGGGLVETQYVLRRKPVVTPALNLLLQLVRRVQIHRNLLLEAHGGNLLDQLNGADLIR